MGPISANRATMRHQFESIPHRDAVDLKVFRELVRRAPHGAWLAMARSCPIAPGNPTAFAAQAVPEDPALWFGLYLVDPATLRVEGLRKVRGGPRQWSNLDTLSDFVESLLDSTGLKGRLRVHVV